MIQMLLTPNKYSRPQMKMEKITKIAVHYVGNAGSTAIANRNYFEGLKDSHKAYASSHYIIGLAGEVVQCVPENEVAYCTNSANSYALSIECCHPKADGKFNEDTFNALVSLCADICKRYGLNPIKDIIRHYDVTGKKCPLYWVTHSEEFVVFKDKVYKKLEEMSEVVTEGIFKVNGTNKKIKRILKDNENYVRLRDLEEVVDIGYESETKVVYINKK